MQFSYCGHCIRHIPWLVHVSSMSWLHQHFPRSSIFLMLCQPPRVNDLVTKATDLWSEGVGYDFKAWFSISDLSMTFQCPFPLIHWLDVSFEKGLCTRVDIILFFYRKVSMTTVAVQPEKLVDNGHYVTVYNLIWLSLLLLLSTPEPILCGASEKSFI